VDQGKVRGWLQVWGFKGEAANKVEEVQAGNKVVVKQELEEGQVDDVEEQVTGKEQNADGDAVTIESKKQLEILKKNSVSKKRKQTNDKSEEKKQKLDMPTSEHERTDSVEEPCVLNSQTDTDDKNVGKEDKLLLEVNENEFRPSIHVRFLVQHVEFMMKEYFDKKCDTYTEMTEKLKSIKEELKEMEKCETEDEVEFLEEIEERVIPPLIRTEEKQLTTRIGSEEGGKGMVVNVTSNEENNATNKLPSPKTTQVAKPSNKDRCNDCHSCKKYVRKSLACKTCNGCGNKKVCGNKLKGRRPDCERWVRCDYCGKSFTNQDGFNTHLKYHEESDQSVPSNKDEKEETKTPSMLLPRRSERFISPNKVFVKQELTNLVNEESNEQLKINNKWKVSPICPHCDYVTPVTRNMRNHLLTHTGERPFECEQCDYKCITEVNLSKHVRRKHSKVPTNPRPKMRKVEVHSLCPDCDYATAVPRNMRLHLLRHKGEKPHKCKHCRYASTTPANLKNHVNSKHTKEKPLACKQCNEKFNTSSALWQHVQRGHMETVKTHKCDSCVYSCAQAKALQTHKLTHTGENPKVISAETAHESFDDATKKKECDLNTDDKELTEKSGHMFIKDEEGSEASDLEEKVKEKETVDTKDQEPKKFTDADGSEGRLKEENGNSSESKPMEVDRNDKNVGKDEGAQTKWKAPSKCPHCDYVTGVKRDMRLHLHRHTEKPHKCDQCSHASTTPANLQNHVNSKHTKEKPHACKQCNDKFSSPSALWQHVRRNHEKTVKTHKCDTCDYSCFRAQALQTHKLTHTGEQPFICNVCGKGFKQKFHLRRHTDKYHTAKEEQGDH